MFTSSTTQKRYFIDLNEKKQIQNTILKQIDTGTGTGSNNQLDTDQSYSGKVKNIITDVLTEPQNCSVKKAALLEAIESLNTERTFDASITLNQKVGLVIDKLNNMRLAPNNSASAVVHQEQSESQDRGAEDRADHLRRLEEEKRLSISKRTAQHTRQSIQSAVDVIARYHDATVSHVGTDTEAEAMFIRRFGAAYRKGLSIRSATAAESVKEMLNHVDHQIRCDVSHSNLLTDADLEILKSHHQHLKNILEDLTGLAQNYSKRNCATLAQSIIKNIEALELGESYILPVTWKRDDASVLQFVSVTRQSPPGVIIGLRGEKRYAISVNASKEVVDKVHPKSTKPGSDKKMFQKFITIEQVRHSEFYQNTDHPLLIEGLLELSMRANSRQSSHSLYLLLGHLNGNSQEISRSYAFYRSQGHWSKEHFTTIERELEKLFLLQGDFSESATKDASRVQLALRLHALEAHFLAWQASLPQQEIKLQLLTRGVENLARRAAKYKQREILTDQQAEEFHHRISRVLNALESLALQKTLERSVERVGSPHSRLVGPEPILVTKKYDHRDPEVLQSYNHNSEIKAHQLQLLPFMKLTAPESAQELSNSLDLLLDYLDNSYNDSNWHYVKDVVITQFIRVLPIPGFEEECFWQQLPEDLISTYTGPLTQLIEVYLQNEASVQRRMPERSLVLGKVAVIVALLVQRVPELEIEGYHFTSLATFLQHEYVDYGNYLSADDGQQFYQLVQWVEAHREKSEKGELLLAIPEQNFRLGHQTITVLTDIEDLNIDKSTLDYFRSFVLGSSKEKNLNGKPNVVFNPIRKSIKEYLKQNIEFSEVTKKTLRALLRDDNLLAVALMSDLGTDKKKGFLKWNMSSLYDLRRLLILTQLTRNNTPKPLVPVDLKLSYTPIERLSGFLDFWCGQCKLVEGGTIALTLPNNLTNVQLTSPVQGHNAFWVRRQFKELMVGKRPTVKESGHQFNYHNRKQSDNQIVVEHFNNGSMHHDARFWLSELNMARDPMRVRKAISFYREHMDLLNKADHRLQLELMLNRNDPYFQVQELYGSQRFDVVPDGGLLQHEFKTDPVNVLTQLSGFLKAGLFKFQAEEKLEPLLLFAKLSQQMLHHLQMSNIKGESEALDLTEFPNGLDQLSPLLHHSSLFMSEQSRGKIAQMVVILLGRQQPSVLTGSQLQLAISAMSVMKTALPNGQDISGVEKEYLKRTFVRLEPQLKSYFSDMGSKERGDAIENILSFLHGSLSGSLLQGVDFNVGLKRDEELKSDSYSSSQWQGQFPLYTRGEFTVNVADGQVFQKGQTIGNRLPYAILSHPLYGTLFGSLKPDCNYLSNGYSILNDSFRIAHSRIGYSGSSHSTLQVQQLVKLPQNEPAWYELAVTKNQLLASIINGIPAILPKNLHFWALCSDQPNNKHVEPSEKPHNRWIATERNNPQQALYQLEYRVEDACVEIQPVDNQALRLVNLKQDRSDDLIDTLIRFEQPNYIALWKNLETGRIDRLTLPRFDLSFFCDEESGDLVWRNDTQFKLSDKRVPFAGGFKGVIQLEDRHNSDKRMALIPRGSLSSVQVDDAPLAQLGNQLKIDLHAKKPSVFEAGCYSYVTVPFEVDVTGLSSRVGDCETEAMLRTSLLEFGMKRYRAAVALLREAKTLNPLTAEALNAVTDLLNLAEINSDWFADAVATRLHVHLFVLDNAQGIGDMALSHIDDLLENLPRYLDLMGDVDRELRLNVMDLRALVNRIDQAVSELTLQSAGDKGPAGEKGSAGDRRVKHWHVVKTALECYVDRVETRELNANSERIPENRSISNISNIVPPTTQLRLSLLHKDHGHLNQFFDHVFNNRDRGMALKELLKQVEHFPVLAPSIESLQSLFKSIFLLMQKDRIGADSKKYIEQRVKLVDASKSVEVARTRQLLTLLLELPNHALSGICYPIDSWQYPTDSGIDGRYEDYHFRDNGSSLDKSNRGSGEYSYPTMYRRYSYEESRYKYYIRYVYSHRGSYKVYDNNGDSRRVNKEISRRDYLSLRARCRANFVEYFKDFYPAEIEMDHVAETIAKPNLLAPTNRSARPELNWPKPVPLAEVPRFEVGAIPVYKGPYRVLAPLLDNVRSLNITSYTEQNGTTASGEKIDLTPLNQGALVKTRSDHVAVLEEQTELYRQHINHWFNQSRLIYQLTGNSDMSLEIEALTTSLRQWVESGYAQLEKNKAEIVMFANEHTDPAVHQQRQLAEKGRNHQPLSWDMLMIRLGQRNVKSLVRSNPSLTRARLQKLHKNIIEQLYNETSLQQAERALSLLQQHARLRSIKSASINDIKKIEADIAAVLATERHYDVGQFPEYLVWEAVGGIILRENQVKVLEHLLYRDEDGGGNKGAYSASKREQSNQPAHEAVMQLIMGAGKTKALLPLYMALVPKIATKLPVAMVPKPLLEINAGDLSLSLRQAFDQMGYTLSFNRLSNTSVSHITNMLERLDRTVAEGGFMITSRESIQALELKLQELLEAALTAGPAERQRYSMEAECLAQYIQRFTQVSDVLIDEIDYTLDTRFEVNYTVGKQQSLLPGRLDIVTTLFQVLIENEALPFSKKLQINEQASIGKLAFTPAIKRILVADVLETAMQFAPYPELLDSHELIGYLSGHEAKPPELIYLLAENGDQRELAQQLVLLKEQISTLLPVTLSKSGGESYGFSIKNPDSFVPGPRDKGKHKEGSDFANPYETLNYLYQLVVDRKFTWSSDKVAAWVDQLQAQQQGEIAEKPMDPENTIANAIFRQVVAPVKEEINSLAHLDVQNSVMMQQVTDSINSQPVARLWLARYLAASSITQAPRKLSNNPYDLVDASGQVQGFSGTLWNARAYPKRLFPATVPETDGKVTKILLDHGKSDVVALQAKEPAQILAELQQNGSIKKSTRAFIDSGALFRGVSGEEVADAILTHYAATEPMVKAVLFFDREDQLLMMRQDRSCQLMRNTDPKTLASTGLTPNERFTYYDQPRTVGTDIGQDPQAHALVSIGLNTTKRDWFQGILRMRKPDTQCFTIVVPDSVCEKIVMQAATHYRGGYTPKMTELLGHSISNESERLSLDKFRAATQQLKNSVTRPLKQALLGYQQEERIEVYGYLQALLSENLVDDPLATMAVISSVDTVDAINGYRDALISKLEQHKNSLHKMETTQSDANSDYRTKAELLIEKQILVLRHFDIDGLVGRLGKLPLTVRSAGMESFGSEVQTEQELEVELEVELEIKAEKVPRYQNMQYRLNMATTAKWSIDEKSVYSYPDLLLPDKKEVLTPYSSQTSVHRVADFGQEGFFSHQLLATNNYLKSSNKKGPDLFYDMKACYTQKPVDFLLVSYEQVHPPYDDSGSDVDSYSNDELGVTILGIEDQQFFIEQLSTPLSERSRVESVRKLCMIDLSGNIIRSGNSGITQEQLDDDHQLRRLRVEAKLLHAPTDRYQLWSRDDQYVVRQWLNQSSGPELAKKKEYIELFCKKLNIDLS